MFFDHIKPSPIDPIFGLSKTFQEDPREEKLNLTIGIYKNDDLETELMPSVALAEETIGKTGKRASYLPFDGDQKMIELLGEVVFGTVHFKNHQKRIYGAQSLGGTGALRIGAEFLLRNVSDQIAMSAPTWANHKPIFERTGFKIGQYKYFDSETKEVDFPEMLRSIEGLPRKSVVLLHACCHNPTGADLTNEQWMQLSDVMLKNELLPFFDFAYQGFAQGLDEDAFAVRHFLEKGHEMLIAYTCSKNFSLYCQRVGTLFVVSKEEKNHELVAGQVKNTIRRNYSNPPFFGEQVVVEVLSNPKLRKQWEEELKKMRERIQRMRKGIFEALKKECPERDFSFLSNQFGMFSFSGLTSQQVDRLREEFAIYMPQSGRLSMVGFNDENISYVAQSISKVLK